MFLLNNVKIKNIEDRIPGITNLASNATLNAEINEVKGEIPSIINLATTAALTTVENKILNVSDLVKKTDYNAKISETKKYIHFTTFTTSDYNKYTSNALDANIKQEKFVDGSDLNEKLKEEIKHLPTSAELKVEQHKIVKLQTFDLSFFIGQSYFTNDGSQNY